MIQVDSPILKIIVSRIVGAVQPDKIILFGSRARDDAQKSSDFDIMAIKKDVSQLSFPRVLKFYG